MTKALGDHEVTGFDIKSGIDARDYFRTNNDYFDVVVHAAAVVGGRTKIDGAPLDLAVDLAIDAEMFQWAMRARPGKVLYFSSSAAYPTHLQVSPDSWARTVEFVKTTHQDFFAGDIPRVLRETDMELNSLDSPDGIYGWIKLTGEKVAAFAAGEGLNVLVTRCFSSYGADQDLDYPFPSFIQKGLQRLDPFPIWGDKSSQRDWIHVEDVCAALMSAIKDDITGTYNLCTGIGTRFDDLARMVCAQIGYEPEIAEQRGQPMGVHTRVGDPTKMNSFYSHTISIEEGIARALKS